MSGDLALKVCQALGVEAQFHRDCQAHFRPKLPKLSQHQSCQSSSNPVDCYSEAVTENLRRNITQLPESQIQMYSRWGLLGKTYSITYTPNNDPVAPNDRIRGIAREIKAQGGDPVQHLFDRLHRGGPEGVRTNFQYDFGKTAIETLDVGGDCSDLSNLTISVIKELNRLGAGIRGGAMVLHFQSSPPDELHMVPYVLKGKKKIIVDLQAGKLGDTGQGKYTVRTNFPNFESAASLYHLEWGHYFKDLQDWDRAIAAYGRSVAIYGQIHRAKENFAKSHVKKLVPQIKNAGDQREWSRCIRLSEEALTWLPHFPAGERENVRQQIQSNIDSCRANQAQDRETARSRRISSDLKREVALASKAYQERRLDDCIRHWTRSISLNGKLPQDEVTRQRTRDMQSNLRLCKEQKSR